MSRLAPTIAYVIGVHNEEDVLAGTVARIVERLAAIPGSEVILVENGSTDRSFEIAKDLEQELSDERVSVRASASPKGLGNALRHGMAIAGADRMVLTAADLPFGFTDLDAALALDPMPDVVVGSKTHPGSAVTASWKRDLMSFGFRAIRRALFGLRIGDTQGSVNIDRRLGQRLLPILESQGYFISTEVVVLAAKAGGSIAEVPVDYSNPREGSKVRPVRDSTEVLRSMWRLRRRVSRLALDQIGE